MLFWKEKKWVNFKEYKISWVRYCLRRSLTKKVWLDMTNNINDLLTLNTETQPDQ